MRRWKLSLSLVIIWMISISALAQSSPRNYIVSTPAVSFSDDESQFTIEFEVTNEGGEAQGETNADIISINDGNRIIAEKTLPVLAAGEKLTVKFTFNSEDFPAGSVEALQIEVGIDQYELAGSPIARDNIRTISVTIPQLIDNLPEDVVVIIEEPDFVIPVVNIPVQMVDGGIIIGGDFYSLQDIFTAVGVIGIGLLLLWFITIILRLLFRRPPTFGQWQPPYASMTYYDPNSTMGRRQAWQHHAQNGTIFQACTQHNVVALKRLLDMEGNNIGAWEIKAIRTVQYDMYGRVSRTETVMPGGIVKKLNKVAHKAPSYSNDKLRKSVNPIARDIAKLTSKKISKKSAMLPIAMDIRFEGKHGEIRILFELYQCRNHAWHLLDQWEPEMAIVGHKIVENYTYTLNGQLAGENFKDYKRRLSEDFAWLLGGMLYRHQVPSQPEPDMVPPDTLTGMAPITEDNMPAVDTSV